ncbi:MAG TPA: response regulator transcription factor [Bdellovibrionota bacterium]|nr:response regulator transcription factor [Bdellovibrionota bacterium]
MNTEAVFSSALLLEDEANLSVALKIALKRLGISCRHASTLEQARKLIDEGPLPEFMLLDRALPDGDGLDLCSEMRDRGYSGAILILTAAGETRERVVGLRTGADDYLPKPFSWEELEARVISLGRRWKTPASALQKPEPGDQPVWTLDRERLRVRGPVGWVELTPLEFKLASRLVDAQGKILTREDLLKNVWGFKFLPKTRTVDHFMGRLRKHFEADAEQPRHFLTVRGAGYRFEPGPTA